MGDAAEDVLDQDISAPCEKLPAFLAGQILTCLALHGDLQGVDRFVHLGLVVPPAVVNVHRSTLLWLIGYPRYSENVNDGRVTVT